MIYITLCYILIAGILLLSSVLVLRRRNRQRYARQAKVEKDEGNAPDGVSTVTGPYIEGQDEMPRKENL